MSPEAVQDATDELREEKALIEDLIALVKGGCLTVDDSGEVERYGLTPKGVRERGPQ